MNGQNIYDVVVKLIGDIEPIGESNTDAIRLNNLTIMTIVIDKLIRDIQYVSKNVNSHQNSVFLIGKKACSFLSNLNDSIQDFL